MTSNTSVFLPYFKQSNFLNLLKKILMCCNNNVCSLFLLILQVSQFLGFQITVGPNATLEDMVRVRLLRYIEE